MAKSLKGCSQGVVKIAVSLPGLEEIPIPSVSGLAGKGLAGLAKYSTAIYITLLIVTLLWILFKFMSHRIEVEKLIRVEGGYIYKSGRYRESWDKTSKRQSLSPMFGREKLPAFDSSHYQNVRGMPFIGVVRNISLVFLNKYSPIVCDSSGKLTYVDTKRWHFDTQKAEYLKKRRTSNLTYFLGIYAPVIIIVGAIMFWAAMVYFQVQTVEKFAEELNVLVQKLGG